MTGNTKALTNEELEFVVRKYRFSLFDDYIVVETNNRNTLHSKDKAFSLLLPLERKRITIGKKAIDLWVEHYVGKYTLIEVQNAINTLVVTYQNPTNENVNEQLKRTRSKLDNLFKEGE